MVAQIGIESLSADISASFERDSSLLEGSDALSTRELTDKISEHLVAEGRSGSAAHLEAYSKSLTLDLEVGLVEAGLYDPVKIEQAGLSAMIDMKATTPEMLHEGKVVLATGVREDFVTSAATVKTKIDTHIAASANRAAGFYGQLAAQEDDLAGKLDAILNLPAASGDIPFTPNDAERAQLSALSKATYENKDAANNAFQDALQQMMRSRPESIGLGASAELSRYAETVVTNLDAPEGTAVDVSNLRALHARLNGPAMDELQIYPGFSKALETSVTRDVAAASVKTEARGEVVYTQGEWLVDDIDDATKKWLLETHNPLLVPAYTPQEQETVKRLASDMYGEAQQRTTPSAEGIKTPVDALKEIEQNEDDQETMRLLLRIAIRVGTKVAVSIAKNIAKDKNTPPELRIALGVFADLGDEGGRFMDKVITGEDKPNLEQDCLNYLRAKFATADDEA